MQLNIQGALIFETEYPKPNVQRLKRSKSSCIWKFW